MIQKKLYLKYFSVYFLVTIVVFIVSLAFSFGITNRNYNQTARRNIEKMGYRIIPVVQEHLRTGDVKGLEEFFGELSGVIGIDVSLVDRERGVVATSIVSRIVPQDCLYSPLIAKVFLGETGDEDSVLITTPGSGSHLAIPVRKAGIVNYIILLSLPDWYFFNFTRQLFLVTLIIVAVVFIIALAGSLIMAQSLLEPVGRILSVASEIAKGNFEAKITLSSNDEFSMIGDSINDMTGKIRSLFDQLTAEKEEFHGIVSSLQEALWVIDNDDRILFANETFKRLAGKQNLEHVPYWEVLRNHQVDRLVHGVKETRKSAVEEIEIDGKYYVVSAQYIPAKKEIIVLFYDISQIKTAEEIKKNLVSSVSHELRTPLTSILGYLETLKSEETDGTKLKYLDVIERNASRMFYLTKDLLELSSLERQGVELEVEQVDIAGMMEGMKRLFAKRFEERGLECVFRIEPGAQLYGDRYKLEQMLANLIDNAVKYTEEGSVTVGITGEGGDAVITVQDTGIGIAAKHHSQIFERFYVADKSRSRQEGGTGLGLSIVLQIVRLHGGTIALDSGLGRGTKFTIRLPAQPGR